MMPSLANTLRKRHSTVRVLHERGLADPRLAADDEHRARTAADTVQQAIQGPAFASTPPEGRRPGCGHGVTISP
jgi:hypothetical protein